MSTFEFKLPDIGEGIVEGEIVKWLVKEGDEVDEDQPMVEVMTDKATVVIPSPRKGRVLKLHGAEGGIARVHAALLTLEVGAGAPAVQAVPSTPLKPEPVANAPAPAATGKVLATPVTRRIAAEHGIDLSKVGGSGPNGRVLKADVLKVVEAKAAPAPAAPVASASVPSVASSDGDERIPLRGLRRAIAKKMVQSKFTAPHYTFVEELDATELKALRARLNERLAKGGGAKLSFLPFIAKALVVALKRFPHLNANFDEAAQELVVRRPVNLGIAVSTEEGLTVPVLKDVQAKTLAQLSEEIGALAAAARERRLRPEDVTGGTFTVTSLGETGGLFATPIINHPEVAILGVHRMRQRPVVREGRIEIREMLNLSLSLDHRVIDGAVGAAFTYELIRLLETPELLLLEMK